MRIEQLDLIRFGHFTDRSLAFPASERDFHVLLGPNEAGKSTIRSAIHDLLYGIPRNTAHGFLHPMPEMRLGARIAHATNTLANALSFVRTKGNKQTLRTPEDGVLDEGALASFLGATDRAFFSQMFGLDHAQLIEGGHSILSASDDLGQILFQSAAGIASLGGVRKALEAEAETLWTPRRAATRAYYTDLDALNDATAALKKATVRTRDWSEAHARLAEIDAAHTQTKEQHKAIQSRRKLLERVRRIQPHLGVLAEVGVQLAALGTVVELAESAAKTLAESEKEMAAATIDLEYAQQQEREAEAALAGIQVDHHIRELATEVTELNERRLQYRAYKIDIPRRQSEVDARWAIAHSLAQNLGWDASDEQLVQARMPSAATRERLERLIRAHAALLQEASAAQRALKNKALEIAQAQASMQALAGAELPLGLQAALRQALKLGDFDAIRRERQELVAQKEAALEQAYQALGAWRCDEAALRAMQPPAAEVLTTFTQEHLADETETRAALKRARTLQEKVKQLELEIQQFAQANQPVSREDVLNARALRDACWQSFKQDPNLLPVRAGAYEQHLSEADTLADRRLDKVQQASELQAKQQQLQRLELELQTERAQVERLEQAKTTRAAQWRQLTQERGLPEVPYLDARAWLEARQLALQASDALSQARRAQATHAQLCTDQQNQLIRELRALGQTPADEALSVLVLQADGIVQAATDAGGQRRTLAAQIADAQAAHSLLAESAAHANAQVDAWQTHWSQALQHAGLGGADDQPLSLTQVEEALAVIQKIDAALNDMHKIRRERIDTMQADLHAQADAARQLAQRCAPELVDHPAEEIAVELALRLDKAKAAHTEWTRQQQAQAQARSKLEQARLRLQKAQSRLAPLFAVSGCQTNAELAECIRRSDEHRRLRQMAASAEKSIREGGDGLPMDQLQAEARSMDMAALLTELEELTAQDEHLLNQLSDLAARRQSATLTLAGIAGAADAAKAEGQRQEAIARMSATVERFLKVFVSARLLKWSIEQYREARQGPMLSLAGSIFSRLTLGSFERLSVDFEHEPLKLQGRRPNGTLVDIEGMSEGTRDQLYLSLRLAALDMHLGQAHAMPFIADDLFINYDDQRAKAGLHALGELSRKTQVLFLTHHTHMLPMVTEVFGAGVNVVRL